MISVYMDKERLAARLWYEGREGLSNVVNQQSLLAYAVTWWLPGKVFCWAMERTPET